VGTGRTRREAWAGELRLVALAGAALALAALSLLRPSAPTTDPWGWILWGRELLHLDLNTATVLSPSWKPLPVLITARAGLRLGAMVPVAAQRCARGALCLSPHWGGSVSRVFPGSMQ